MTPGADPSCPNDNHGRMTIRVRHCPACGDLLNANISKRRCSPSEHRDRRRRRQSFCVDCGLQLRWPS